MTYLSPHVYHIICRIPEEASESAVKENDYEERTVAIDHLAINCTFNVKMFVGWPTDKFNLTTSYK